LLYSFGFPLSNVDPPARSGWRDGRLDGVVCSIRKRQAIVGPTNPDQRSFAQRLDAASGEDRLAVIDTFDANAVGLDRRAGIRGRAAA